MSSFNAQVLSCRAAVLTPLLCVAFTLSMHCSLHMCMYYHHDYMKGCLSHRFFGGFPTCTSFCWLLSIHVRGK